MNEQEIDLRELWQIVRTNQKTIAKITGGFLGLAVAYLLIVPNTYQSTALLRIKQERGLSSSIMEQLPIGNAQLTKQQMNTNAEILKSRHVVIPVIEQTEEEKDGKTLPAKARNRPRKPTSCWCRGSWTGWPSCPMRNLPLPGNFWNSG